MGVLLAGLSICVNAIAQEMPVTRFIVSTANSRMIIADESRLAAEAGTTTEIKEYGELMVKDQGRLLGELKRLAVLRNITIPDSTNGNELAEITGRQFNSTYIKTMIAEHERDIKLFKQAVAYGDPEVSEFAKRYLPVIEDHLKKVKGIKKR